MYYLNIFSIDTTQRIPAEDKRHTFEFDREFLFVCIVEDGITFLCLCQQNAEMRRVFGFLENVKKIFMTQFRYNYWI